MDSIKYKISSSRRQQFFLMDTGFFGLIFTLGFLCSYFYLPEISLFLEIYESIVAFFFFVGAVFLIILSVILFIRFLKRIVRAKYIAFSNDELIATKGDGHDELFNIEDLIGFSPDGYWLNFETRDVPIDFIRSQKPTALTDAVFEWLESSTTGSEILNKYRFDQLLIQRANSIPWGIITRKRQHFYAQTLTAGHLISGLLMMKFGDIYLAPEVLIWMGLIWSIVSSSAIEFHGRMLTKRLKAFDEKHPEVIAYLNELKTEEQDKA